MHQAMSSQDTALDFVIYIMMIIIVILLVAGVVTDLTRPSVPAAVAGKSSKASKKRNSRHLKHSVSSKILAAKTTEPAQTLIVEHCDTVNLVQPASKVPSIFSDAFTVFLWLYDRVMISFAIAFAIQYFLSINAKPTATYLTISSNPHWTSTIMVLDDYCCTSTLECVPNYICMEIKENHVFKSGDEFYGSLLRTSQPPTALTFTCLPVPIVRWKAPPNYCLRMCLKFRRSTSLC
ncbi:hypothetical protein BC829DRAFT_272011 [Chytridium lagenaria]|nr:hypothetical protein BC829DRAFT_272011 [Chytridium lagenaria]